MPGALTVESPPCAWGPNDSKLSNVLFGWHISSNFGPRVDPLGRGQRGWHGGGDLVMPEGTPLLSPSWTEVISAGWDNGGGGNWTTLRDTSSNDWFGFGHQSQIKVQRGQMLAPGELIGYSGNTGGSTGPHLHLAFESAADPDHTWDNPFPLFQALEDSFNNGGPVEMPLSNEDITKIANAVAATLTADDIFKASLARKVWWAVSGQAFAENHAAGKNNEWTVDWATLDMARRLSTGAINAVAQVGRKLGAKVSINSPVSEWDPNAESSQWST